MNFFLVLKQTGPQSWKPVYKSEIKAHFNKNFLWDSLNLLTSDLVNDNNIDMAFKFEFYQSQKNGRHTNLGHTLVTIAEVNQGKKDFLIINKKGQTDPS